LVLENPPPPGNSNPFCGGSMNIFWYYTFFVLLPFSCARKRKNPVIIA